MWLFEKLINQLQVRIQAEPPHGKYSGGNSASFLTSKLFLKTVIFPDPLNLLLGTSDDSKWHPKGPRTILGKSVFWPSSTFLVATFWPSSWPSSIPSYDMICYDMICHDMIWWDDMMDFAAANAAATTRLSVGNEEVFRNFTSEKWLVLLAKFYFIYLFLAGFLPRLTPRPRPVWAMEMSKFSRILSLKNDLYFFMFSLFFIWILPGEPTGGNWGNRRGP